MHYTKLFLIGLLVISSSIMKDKGETEDETGMEEEEVALVSKIPGSTL